MSLLCYFPLQNDFDVYDPEEVQNCDINNMWRTIPHAQLGPSHLSLS